MPEVHRLKNTTLTPCPSRHALRRILKSVPFGHDTVNIWLISFRNALLSAKNDRFFYKFLLFITIAYNFWSKTFTFLSRIFNFHSIKITFIKKLRVQARPTRNYIHRSNRKRFLNFLLIKTRTRTPFLAPSLHAYQWKFEG